MDKVKRKAYAKPQITRVKLELNEAVLQACKANPADSAGKNKFTCASKACKSTFGS